MRGNFDSFKQADTNQTRTEQVLAPIKRATLAFMWGYIGSSKELIWIKTIEQSKFWLV